MAAPNRAHVNSTANAFACAYMHHVRILLRAHVLPHYSEPQWTPFTVVGADGRSCPAGSAGPEVDSQVVDGRRCEVCTGERGAPALLVKEGLEVAEAEADPARNRLTRVPARTWGCGEGGHRKPEERDLIDTAVGGSRALP